MNTNIKLIAENTWQIEDGFVRFFLLAGNERSLLIDTGVSGMDTRAIASSLTNLPISLINTHGDGDHISDNASFEEFYMNQTDYINQGIEKKIPGSRCIPVCDGDTIDLGNRVLEIIGIPGHTYGSIAILDTATGILFSGDSVQNGIIYMFGSHRAPSLFPESLKTLAARKSEIQMICPSHGDCPIAPDYTDHVIEAVDLVNRGEVVPTPAMVRDNEVNIYLTPWCGFYTDINFNKFND